MKLYTGFEIVVYNGSCDEDLAAECDFYYQESRHWDEDCEVELVRVKINGVDVSKSIPSYQWNSIESQLLEQMISSSY